MSALLAYKIDVLDEDIFDWAPEQVEQYLLEVFPERGQAPDSEIPAIPDRLWAFFNHLGAGGRVDAESMRRAANMVTRHRDELVRRARDRNRYSPAKTILLEMQRQGVDPTDRQAVARFMEDFNARVAEPAHSWTHNL